MSVVIESAGADDAAAMAEIHRVGLSAGYRGRVPDRVLAAPPDVKPQTGVWRKWLQRTQATTFVARVGAEVVGFCTLQTIRNDEGKGTMGEIPIIVVHPSHWRRGIGRVLCDQVLDEAWRQGFSEVVLWVVESNDRARQFYRSLGFRPDGEKRVFNEGPDALLHELRYRRCRDAASRHPTCG